MKKQLLFQNKYGKSFQNTIKSLKEINKKINSYNIHHQTKAVIYLSKQIYKLIKDKYDLENELPKLIYKDITWFWGSLSIVYEILNEYTIAEKMDINSGYDINDFLNVVFSTEKILNIIINNYTKIYNRLVKYVKPKENKQLNMTSYLVKYNQEITFPDKDNRKQRIYAFIDAIYEL